MSPGGSSAVKMWTRACEADQLKRQLSNEGRLRAQAEATLSEARRVSARRSAAEVRGQHQVHEVQLQKLQELQQQNAAFSRRCEELEARERDWELQQHGAGNCAVCASRRGGSTEIDAELAKLRDAHYQNDQRLRQHMARAAETAHLREGVDEEAQRFVAAARHVKELLKRSEAKRAACQVVHAAVIKSLLLIQNAEVLNLSAQVVAGEAQDVHGASPSECRSPVGTDAHSEPEEIEAEATPLSAMEAQKLRREVENQKQRAETLSSLNVHLRSDNAQLLEACSVKMPDGYAPHHKKVRYISQLKDENTKLRDALREATNALHKEKAKSVQSAHSQSRRRPCTLSTSNFGATSDHEQESKPHVESLTIRRQSAAVAPSANTATAATRTPRHSARVPCNASASTAVTPRRLEDAFTNKRDKENRAIQAARRTRSMR